MAVLFFAGVAAGAINSVAGGGSLVSFPLLHFGAGIPSIPANATNAVALWPGSIASAVAGRSHLERMRPNLISLLLPTMLGSALGAFLLSLTNPKVFDLLVPVLILVGAVLLFLQPKIRAMASRENRRPNTWLGAVAQTLIAIYGGYFGAGIGILMLGAFSATLDRSFHEINVLKNVLAVVINVTASIVFIAQGLVLWLPVVVTALGSIVGGYGFGKISQRFDAERMRLAIGSYGVVMALYFAWKAFP